LRILLTGRNGQVGWELQRALPVLGQVIGTDRTTLDLTEPDAIRQAVREARPDVIVNAAAYTAVDKAESEPDAATQVNAVAPAVLAEEAKRLGALLLHYSTDYVFDGAKRAPYTEEDPPSPLSHYARSKLEGERAIAAVGGRYLILRTSWVYGPRTTNFYRLILDKARTNAPMRMVDDQTSVPTPSSFVARQTLEFVAQGETGLFHLVPAGAATRYEFACEVVRKLSSRSSVQRAQTLEFPTAAPRPSYSVLDSRKAAALLRVDFPDWKNLLASQV
jgi:dTDP-4-dehydrorhamnose reductase